jgi:hypothetical protein
VTTPAPTVVKTITAAEIRDVTHYCHFIPALKGLRSAVMYRFPEYTPFELLTALRAARAVKRDSHFSVSHHARTCRTSTSSATELSRW